MTGKRLLAFVTISLTIHCYLLLFLLITSGLDFSKPWRHPAKLNPADRKEEVDETVVETMTQEDVKPLKAKMSDKANPDRGKLAEKNRYNYPNPEPKPRAGLNAQEGSAQKNDQKQKKDQKDDQATEVVLSEPDRSAATAKTEAGGDPHTSLFTVESNISVDMTSEGDPSVATVSNEYAPYFLAMQQKVRITWQNFFPIFQYYQGILNNGEVEVVYQVTPQGDVVNARIDLSYGYRIMDDASLNAIVYSRNFGPLPEKLAAKGNVTVRFRFVYMKK